MNLRDIIFFSAAHGCTRNFISPIKCLVFFIFVFSVPSINGQEATITYTPASFYDDDRSLAQKIKFPDADENVRVLIRCYTSVERRGVLNQSYCLSEGDNYASYERSVLIATRKFVTMNPAKINGSPVYVNLIYSVLFEKINGVESIKVYPHDFINYSAYGSDYTAPQWYDTERPTSSQYCRNGLELKIWVSMNIDENGLPNDINVLNKEKYSDTCLRTVLQHMSSGKYIPAFHNGKPVKAKFIRMYVNYLAVDQR